VQVLTPDHRARRVFCQWLPKKCVINTQFVTSVFLHTPLSSRDQHCFSISVWVGILGDQHLGPVVLTNRVMSAVYYLFSMNDLLVLLDYQHHHFLLFLRVGWDYLVCWPLFGLLCQPRMIDDNEWSILWNENWQGKMKYAEKTCPNDTLSTTNPTWPDLGSNLGHHGGKSATNCLSCGMNPTLGTCDSSTVTTCVVHAWCGTTSFSLHY
jgi:hypothetical protein